MKQKDIDRFWSKVDIKGPDDCWEWKAGKDKDGYGKFSVGEEANVASRVSYFISNKNDDNFEFLCVLHSCDNPSCVNPNHLRLGTHKDNSDDKFSRNRFSNGNQKGSNNPKSKLTEKQIKEIVELISNGNYNTEIAQIYSVDHSTISRIRKGKTWKHV